MLNSVILSYITFIYFLSFLFYLLMMVIKKQAFGIAATSITLIGLLGHTFGLILRWIESYKLGIGHAPLSNLYESLIFFSWTIVLFYLLVEWRIKNRSIGTFVTPIAFLALAYASFSDDVRSGIQPLVPALQSNWLTAHVITCFFGYAAFALSFGLSLMYLLKKYNFSLIRIISKYLLKLDIHEKKSSFLTLIPRTGIIEDLSYQMVLIGFLMLTIGIITGSVWANSAWGSYWSWDPKETWSLITWLIYATLLHARMIRGWKGNRIAFLCIIGFACVLFTYFGVNYLAGLHSYAT